MDSFSSVSRHYTYPCSYPFHIIWYSDGNRRVHVTTCILLKSNTTSYDDVSMYQLLSHVCDFSKN